jgi:hypothetical protein
MFSLSWCSRSLSSTRMLCFCVCFRIQCACFFRICARRISYFCTIVDRVPRIDRDPRQLWRTALTLALNKVRARKWPGIKEFRQDVRRYIACYHHTMGHTVNPQTSANFTAITSSAEPTGVGVTADEAIAPASTAPSFVSPTPRSRGSFVAATPIARTTRTSSALVPQWAAATMDVIEQRHSSFQIMLMRELAEHEARVYPLLCQTFPDRFTHVGAQATSSLLSKTGAAIASLASYVGLTPKTPKRAAAGADLAPPPTLMFASSTTAPDWALLSHELESPWRKFRPYNQEKDGGAGSREDWELFYSREGRTRGTLFASLSGYSSRPGVPLPLDPHERWREWQRQSLVVFEHALPLTAEGCNCSVCSKPLKGRSFDTFSSCGHSVCSSCMAMTPQCRQCRTVRDALSFQVNQSSVLVQHVIPSNGLSMSSQNAASTSHQGFATLQMLTNGETVLPVCSITMTKLRVHGRIRPHASDLSCRILRITICDERPQGPNAIALVAAAVTSSASSSSSSTTTAAPAGDSLSASSSSPSSATTASNISSVFTASTSASQEPNWTWRPHPFRVVLGLRGHAFPDGRRCDHHHDLSSDGYNQWLRFHVLPPDQTLDAREEDGVPDIMTCIVTRSVGCQDPSPALHRTLSTGS